MLRSKIFLLFLCLFSSTACFGQLQIAFNANLDMELSKGGDLSHYYYNEIHNSITDWHFDLSQANLMASFIFSEQWKINGRLLMKRRLGLEFEQLRIPQLNIQWFPKEKNYSLTLGRFINPFGSFNEKQLSTQRTFISIPLAYSYYHNVSQEVGLMLTGGRFYKIQHSGSVDWGTTNQYYGGYVTGLQFNWWSDAPKPTSLKVALTNGASNIQQILSSPLSLGLVSRLQIQPSYFWKQGFSLSFGSFMESAEINKSISELNQYYQLLIGTDYSLGSGFFSFSGELTAAFYKVPVFDPETMVFLGDADPISQRLSSFSTYFDVKYEPPFFSGSFLAYRIDALIFGRADIDGLDNDNWDNSVLRHSIGLGYKVLPFLLLRTMISTQSVQNKPQWDTRQRAFRLMLTLHY